MKWSYDGTMIASGGNDNIVNIFNMRSNKVTQKLTEHTAAIKALAWSPHQSSILLWGLLGICGGLWRGINKEKEKIEIVGIVGQVRNFRKIEEENIGCYY